MTSKRVYLAGAIDCAPDFGKGWRDEIIPWLKELGFVVFNPMDNPIEGHLENEEIHIRRRESLRESGQFDELESDCIQIRDNDLKLVHASDFCICYIDRTIFMCGTMEEITHFNIQNKPVFVVVKQGKEACPGWIFGMFGHNVVFDNFSQLQTHLKLLINSTITNDRWYNLK